MSNPIRTAPPGSGTAVLGRTLPSLLYDSRYPSNPKAINQPTETGWKPLSTDDFRVQSEEVALGLLDLGLERGDRVGLYMESDVPFCVADMGCLIAGLIDVPIYLTSSPEAIQFVIEHAEAKALFVSSEAHLAEIADVLHETPAVKTIVVAEPSPRRTSGLPKGVEVIALEALRGRGRARRDADAEAISRLLDQIDPHDVATLIYTSGTTGRPKGVVLTHENISFNSLTSFSGIMGYVGGTEGETAISFLPMTHIFARTLHYGYLFYRTSVYFTTPDRLGEDLKKVRPTTFATVPRVLEKVYSRIREKAATLTGAKKRLLQWSLSLAGRYELGRTPTGLYALQLKLADLIVFRQWREALGGRVKYVICGGAALNADLANIFAAAGVTVLQGYGLTETSPVIAFNRPNRNRAGTVGEPLPDVEVKLADDGEILTRGPHVMQGYYKDEEKTAEVIDADGWFHTGDVGEFTDEDFLRITDRKKDLFKLSTGKYVMPQPLENELTTEPLVEQAVVVGAGRKFCAALLFPDQDTLRVFARSRGIGADGSVEALIEHPVVRRRYQELVDKANRGMDPWSTIKRFALIPAHLTVENGLLTPTLKVKRRPVHERFAGEIEALYAEAERERSTSADGGVAEAVG